MKRRILISGLAVCGLAALTACGGSSKSGPKSFLKDVSGAWAGTAGGAPASMNLDQGKSDTITGSITLFGTTTTIAGIKNGNNVTLSGSAGNTRFVVELTLASETQMSGSIAQATGLVSSTVTATFTKS